MAASNGIVMTRVISKMDPDEILQVLLRLLFVCFRAKTTAVKKYRSKVEIL